MAASLSLARYFAFAGAFVGLAQLFYFSDGYLLRQLPVIALWAGATMPLAYWIGKLLVKTTRGARVLTAGLGLALALGIFGFWDVTLGSGREESLAGLIVIFMPAYQLAVLVVALVLAWLA
jgi:hypothetical protein